MLSIADNDDEPNQIGGNDKSSKTLVDRNNLEGGSSLYNVSMSSEEFNRN